MTDPGSGNVDVTLLQRQVQELRRHQSLQTGGGGGTFDGMEPRVSRLETQFEKLNDKVDGLRIDVAVLRENVRHLPTKGFIVSALVAALGLIGALIVFQDRLTNLLG